MKKNKLLSLIVPVFYEEDCIEQFLKETSEVLDSLEIDYEYVFVDDGSKDQTVQILKTHSAYNSKIKLIEFSYNHGKQAAVTAGINYAKGDYLLYMDPDLQDPPIEIPRFITEIEKGFDIVYGIREEKQDSIINTVFSKIFWWTLSKFTGLNVPTGLAVMRIFNRKFANVFINYKEQNRFIEGIFLNIGLKSNTMQISQRKRFAGKSKFDFRRKMKLAFDAIFDFSELPLKLSLKIGFLFSFLGILGLILIIILRFFISFQAGWPSIIAFMSLMFGMILFFIGLSAIYIGKIYKEVKNRPLYSIKETTNS